MKYSEIEWASALLDSNNTINNLKEELKMKDKLELDPRILQKNLEISKLTQQVDSLKSKVIDLEEQLKEMKRVTK